MVAPGVQVYRTSRAGDGTESAAMGSRRRGSGKSMMVVFVLRRWVVFGSQCESWAQTIEPRLQHTSYKVNRSHEVFNTTYSTRLSAHIRKVVFNDTTNRPLCQLPLAHPKPLAKGLKPSRSIASINTLRHSFHSKANLSFKITHLRDFPRAAAVTHRLHCVSNNLNRE